MTRSDALREAAAIVRRLLADKMPETPDEDSGILSAIFDLEDGSPMVAGEVVLALVWVITEKAPEIGTDSWAPFVLSLTDMMEEGADVLEVGE